MDKKTFSGRLEAIPNRARMSWVELWDNGAEPVKARYRSDALLLFHMSGTHQNTRQWISDMWSCVRPAGITPTTPQARAACGSASGFYFESAEEVRFSDRDLDFGGSSAEKDPGAHSAVRRWSEWIIHAATFSQFIGGKHTDSRINDTNCSFPGRSRWGTSSNEVSWSWDSNMKVLLFFMCLVCTCALTVSLQILRSTVGRNKC